MTFDAQLKSRCSPRREKVPDVTPVRVMAADAGERARRVQRIAPPLQGMPAPRGPLGNMNLLSHLSMTAFTKTVDGFSQQVGLFTSMGVVTMVTASAVKGLVLKGAPPKPPNLILVAGSAQFLYGLPNGIASRFTITLVTVNALKPDGRRMAIGILHETPVAISAEV